MEIGSSAATSGAQIADSKNQGFAALKADDFMRMLIVELQNQDPSEPMGNEQLLNQLSAMQSLQSNVELGEALGQVTSNLQLSTGASFIGKLVTGKNAAGADVTGIVERAFLTEGKTAVEVGGETISLKNISSVNLPRQ